MIYLFSFRKKNGLQELYPSKKTASRKIRQCANCKLFMFLLMLANILLRIEISSVQIESLQSSEYDLGYKLLI